MTLGWLGRIAAALLVLALVALGNALAQPDHPLRRALGEHRARWQQALALLRAPLSPRFVLLVQATSIGAGVLLALVSVEAAAAAALCALAPELWLRRALARRRERLEGQLETWLGALSNALVATAALGDAIQESARVLDAPLADELALVGRETALGTPLDAALERAAQRCGSALFKGVVTTLKIARNTGGHLPTTLRTASDSLREMARLDGVIRTKTAEGRVQAAALCGLPILLYYLLVTLRPDHFTPMDESALGGVLYAIAGVCWLAAILLTRRILRIER